jgi:hypothetical protein
MAAKRGPKGEASPKRKPTAQRKARASKRQPAAKPAARSAKGKTTGAVKRTAAQQPAPELAVRQAPAAEKRKKTTPAPKATGKRAKAPPAPADNRKAKRGRPTDYRPEMCKRVRALASEGKSKAQIAVALGISRTSWHSYQEAHAEFLDAVKDAEWLAQAWWEDKGQTGIVMGKDFNAASWIFQMKNRFKGDYQDARHQKLDIADPLTSMLRELDGATGRFRAGS